MNYRFQGFPQERIADFLDISDKASMTWSRAFTATLAEYDSELYRWWEDHQSTDISALTTEAEEALEQCIMALTNLRTLTDRHCA
ncbi:hypothetical protein [Salinicola tamaricis]|uniref:hypothetical protein n=1 Tax=Salinicola tamaricis TaxID=1771309 RepID=UPI000D09A968|nr:hypothetical protein [Salinicola tamaricis]